MGFMDIFRGREQRRQVKASDGYLNQFLGNRLGMVSHVDADRASGLAVAHACITLISQNLAAVPLHVYRFRSDGGRERATEHPVYDLLQSLSCDGMTAFEVREALIADLLITGNAYAKLTWNGRGQVSQLMPLSPGAVAVERLPSGALRYRATYTSGRSETLLEDEVLHIRYRLDRERVMGLSPLAIARETFNIALEQNVQAHRQARYALRSEGVLSIPNPMSDEAYTRTQAQAQAIMDPPSGSRPAMMILDGGAEYKPMAFSPKDGEFLESRKLTNLDVCRVFNVPPSSVGIPDSMTYSNAAEEGRTLVSRCLAPMARRVEAAMNTAMLTATGRLSFFIEHDLSGLMRGDLQARYEAFGLARQNGWLSVNEIRQMESLGRIEGGDRYLEPLNMTGARDAAEVE